VELLDILPYNEEEEEEEALVEKQASVQHHKSRSYRNRD
jgi:hypothetical protein